VTPEDRKAKAEFIDAYFADLERRIALLPRLHAANYKDEALLLCCCYIDGLATNLYWPEEGSARNFVRVLQEHGGEELLCHVHPKELIEAFDSKRSLRNLAARIATLWGFNDHRLRALDEAITELSGGLAAGEVNRLRTEIWRGTLAHLVYTTIRCQAVHRLGASPLLLSETTLRGQPVPPLDFDLLHPVIGRIREAAASLSTTTNTWFGHDFREP
jgi:hypothetical protein